MPAMNHDAQADTSLIKLKIVLMNERENKKNALDIYWVRQNELSISVDICIVTV